MHNYKEALLKRISNKLQEGNLERYNYYICNIDNNEFVTTSRCYEELFLYLNSKNYLNINNFLKSVNIKKQSDIFNELKKHYIFSKLIQEVSFDD
jgi:hypothetical protein